MLLRTSQKYKKQIYNVDVEKILTSFTDSYVFWKDLNSRFLGCNQKFLASTGRNTQQNFVESSDYDMPWAQKYADIYIKDDQNVMETGIPRINYKELHQQLDGTIKTVLVSKIPLYDEYKQVKGLLGFYIDISIQEIFTTIRLSKRQMECLFYLVRGMSAKQIARKLNLSNRTVEDYLENLKLKFDCTHRSDLVIKAIEMGFGNVAKDNGLLTC